MDTVYPYCSDTPYPQDPEMQERRVMTELQIDPTATTAPSEFG